MCGTVIYMTTDVWPIVVTDGGSVIIKKGEIRVSQAQKRSDTRNERQEVAEVCERRLIAAASFVMRASNEDFLQLRRLSKATDDELRNRKTG